MCEGMKGKTSDLEMHDGLFLLRVALFQAIFSNCDKIVLKPETGWPFAAVTRSVAPHCVVMTPSIFTRIATGWKGATDGLRFSEMQGQRGIT